MTEIEQNRALLGLTAEIVSAHVKNNPVPAAELPVLIEQVYLALRDAGQAHAPAPAHKEARPELPERPAPFVSPKKSVFPDYIICLEDGRKLKTLKRHLRSTYNMTPEQYREKWDLAADYPMVAPNYAEHRSTLAKQLGLGRKPAASAAEAQKPDSATTKAAVELQPAAIPSQLARPAPPSRDPAAEPIREPRTDHTAASVFAGFPRQAEDRAEPPPAPDSGPRKSTRKPFSKQLARGMRP